MSSPVESVAVTNDLIDKSVESEDEGQSVELNDEVKDTVDVPVEGESRCWVLGSWVGHHLIRVGTWALELLVQAVFLSFFYIFWS
jgi:hypothetical protein